LEERLVELILAAMERTEVEMGQGSPLPSSSETPSECDEASLFF
jgi:hypothetical protein